MIKNPNSTYVVGKRPQRTLRKKVSFSGVGVHNGEDVTMTLLPSTANSGIVFKRVDKKNAVIVPAHITNLHGFSRSTNIGTDENKILTVEHVLAALRACQIDNVLIELDASEPPIADGGALLFVELIEKAGIQELGDTVPICQLNKPIYFSNKDVQLIALPSDTFRVSYTLHYPNCNAIRSQFYTFELTQEGFKREIAPCRTFCLYEEVALLIDQGLIKGGSLDNAVVIKGDSIVNPEGLKFPDEVARHKILDVIGDTTLLGFPFNAHIIGLRSGHASNGALVRQLYELFTAAESEKLCQIM